MIPITAITPTNVAKYFDASGKSTRLNRISPYVPTFNSNAARRTEPAVGASVCASGSQVCSGTNGTFTANAMKNARNNHRAVVAGRPSATPSSASYRKLSEPPRSEEHTSELQSPCNLVCRLLLEKKKQTTQ